MHIRTSNNKEFLVLNKSEFIALGKEAGWFGDTMSGIGRAVRNPSKYWQGLQSVDNIMKQSPDDQQAHWQAFQSVPQIGQGLSTFKQNIGNDIKILQRIENEAIQIAQISKNPHSPQLAAKEQEAKAELQNLYNALSEPGQQLFNKALQNVGIQISGQDIQLKDMAPVATEAIKLCEGYLNPKAQLGFDVNQGNVPNLMEPARRIIQEVLALPRNVQLQVVNELSAKVNPVLPKQKRTRKAPATPVTQPELATGTGPL